MIPDAQRGKTKAFKGRYDHLDEERKNELIRQEQEDAERLNNKTRKDLEKLEQQEEAKREKQKKIQRQKRLEGLKTPIVMTRNKILVPVTLKYSNKEVSTMLLLDTGASITSVNQSVAEKLGVNEGKSSTTVVCCRWRNHKNKNCEGPTYKSRTKDNKHPYHNGP